MYLPRWAAHEDQTPERIRAALEELEQLAEGLPSLSEPIAVEYTARRRMLLEYLDADNMIPFWIRSLPWEKARTTRLLNYLASEDMAYIRRFKVEVERNWRALYLPDERDEQERQWIKTTPPFQAGGLGSLVRPLVEARLRMEAERRAARLLLALQAWKLEHGKLPETLDALVGPYFEELPIDPYCGKPFRYLPDGLATAIPAHRFMKEAEPGRPLIWSTGPDVQYNGNDDSFDSCALIRDDATRSAYRPESENDVWRAGLAFPLP